MAVPPRPGPCLRHRSSARYPPRPHGLARSLGQLGRRCGTRRQPERHRDRLDPARGTREQALRRRGRSRRSRSLGNFSTNEIRVANLNGTRAVTLFTEPAGSAPSGDVIDPANNKIYWTNQFSDEVRAGNLDGSGTPQTLFAGEDNPIGVAADPAAGKIYWTDLDSDTVRVGPLGGSTVGIPETLFNGPVAERPSDRSNGEQDTTGQAGRRTLGSGPGTSTAARRRLDPFRRRDRTGVRRAAEGASEHAAPRGSPAEPRSGASSHLPKRDVGARPARVVPVRAPPASAIGGREMGRPRRRSGVHAQPDRRLHLHRQGHQPGRVDLADSPRRRVTDA